MITEDYCIVLSSIKGGNEASKFIFVRRWRERFVKACREEIDHDSLDSLSVWEGNESGDSSVRVLLPIWEIKPRIFRFNGPEGNFSDVVGVLEERRFTSVKMPSFLQAGDECGIVPVDITFIIAISSKDGLEETLQAIHGLHALGHSCRDL